MHCSSQVKTTPAPMAWPLALGLLILAMLGGSPCIPGTQEFVTIPFLNVKTMKEGRKEGGSKRAKGREVSNTAAPKESDSSALLARNSLLK